MASIILSVEEWQNALRRVVDSTSLMKMRRIDKAKEKVGKALNKARHRGDVEIDLTDDELEILGDGLAPQTKTVYMRTYAEWYAVGKLAGKKKGKSDPEACITLNQAIFTVLVGQDENANEVNIKLTEAEKEQMDIIENTIRSLDKK